MASQRTWITLEGRRTLGLGVSEERFTEATRTRSGVRNGWVLMPGPMRQVGEAGRRQGPPRAGAGRQLKKHRPPAWARPPRAPVCQSSAAAFSMESSSLPPKVMTSTSPPLFSHGVRPKEARCELSSE